MEISVKNKEIKLKEDLILIKGEVASETHRFIIEDLTKLNKQNELLFNLYFSRSETDNGMDVLTRIPDDEKIVLEWKPSGNFTKNSGLTKIQLIGYKKIQNRYSVIWCSLSNAIYIQDDILNSAEVVNANN